MKQTIDKGVNRLHQRRVIGIMIVLLILVVSCQIKTKPYFKHKLAFSKKLSEGCSGYDPKFSMSANIIGERYVFQECLHTTYDNHYTAARKGDTLDINFTKAEGPQALYEITFDIDAYPRYRFLKIGASVFAVALPDN